MNTLRIALIGAGFAARERHLANLTKLEDVKVTRVWSRRKEQAVALAGTCGAQVSEGWEQAVESPEVDAVVVAVPPHLHAPVTLRALAAGKHVLCQGRMARNVLEARAMAAAAAKSDRVTALYPPRPGLKGDRVMRSLLRERAAIGEICEVRVTGLSHLALSGDYKWTLDPEVVGVNSMVLGLWNEILNRWVGPAARVRAATKCVARERVLADGGRAPAVVPDSIVIAANLQGGATASYHLSTNALGGGGHGFEFFGTKGSISYRLFDETIRLANEKSEWADVAIPDQDVRLQTTDQEFVRAIREGVKVEPSFKEGVEYIEFCEAVAYSAWSGTAVDLPLSHPRMQAWNQVLPAG